jgi:hypothetical protein
MPAISAPAHHLNILLPEYPCIEWRIDSTVTDPRPSGSGFR